MMLPQVEKRCTGEYYHASGKRLGYRETDPRNQKLICPQSFDPDTPKRVSEYIQEEKFSFIFLMFPYNARRISSTAHHTDS